MMRDNRYTDDSPNEHRTGSESYTAYHDWSSDRPLSDTVYEAFAAVADTDGGHRPMYDSLDVGALDQLFHSGTDRPTTHGLVQFVHDGYEIEVHASGLVRVEPRDTGGVELAYP